MSETQSSSPLGEASEVDMGEVLKLYLFRLAEEGTDRQWAVVAAMSYGQLVATATAALLAGAGELCHRHNSKELPAGVFSVEQSDQLQKLAAAFEAAASQASPERDPARAVAALINDRLGTVADLVATASGLDRPDTPTAEEQELADQVVKAQFVGANLAEDSLERQSPSEDPQSRLPSNLRDVFGRVISGLGLTGVLFQSAVEHLLDMLGNPDQPDAWLAYMSDTIAKLAKLAALFAIARNTLRSADNTAPENSASSAGDGAAQEPPGSSAAGNDVDSPNPDAGGPKMGPGAAAVPAGRDQQHPDGGGDPQQPQHLTLVPPPESEKTPATYVLVETEEAKRRGGSSPYGTLPPGGSTDQTSVGDQVAEFARKLRAGSSGQIGLGDDGHTFSFRQPCGGSIDRGRSGSERGDSQSYGGKPPQQGTGAVGGAPCFVDLAKMARGSTKAGNRHRDPARSS